MIIAITGGSGFVGQQLLRYYVQKGYEVRVLSRKELKKGAGFDLFCGDLSDSKVDLSNFVDKVDILFHCAGEIRNESLMEALHVGGTKRLVDAAKGKIGRWVQLSSVGAYGRNRGGIISEESIENPFSLYEKTKTQSDMIVTKSGIPYCILRPSNVFGDSMPNQSLTSLLRTIKQGLFFFIGKEHAYKVNYVHVEDVVNAMISCSIKAKALEEVFILSQTTSVEEMIYSFASGLESNKKIFRLPLYLVRLIMIIFGKLFRFPLTTSRVEALTGRCVYNSSKVERILSFKFSMSLEERFRLFAKQK
jgi:nucleoside-diphosphate-sugar epimerase